MLKCLICQREIVQQLRINDFLGFGPRRLSYRCQNCSQRFINIGNDNNQCRFCQKFLQDQQLTCTDCLEWQARYSWQLKNQALFHYNEAMKEYMKRYKFQGDYYLRYVFQADLRAKIHQQEYDYLVPIPVTKFTMQTRGFNQVLGFLEHVDCKELLVHRHDNKQRQSAKTRIARLQGKQPLLCPSTFN